MRIASWNINSVRARTDRLGAWLEAQRPDVLCLQELKCLDSAFPHEAVEAAGYTAATHGEKTYNGVAILARHGLALEDVRRGMADDAEDPQARVITATVGSVRVISVYVPNGRAVGTDHYAYKLAWLARLRRYLDARHRPTERLAVCGDFNVAPDDRDIYDPAAFEGQVLCSEPERAALAHLVDFGLVDTFRLHHAEAGRYSWWDYQALGFPLNKGLRIDHVLATRSLAEVCAMADIDREARKGVKPSDHAPVWATFLD